MQKKGLTAINDIENIKLHIISNGIKSTLPKIECIISGLSN